MSNYGAVFTKIWADKKFRDMTESDRHLFLYLLTCEHRNLIGFFRVPLQYIAHDLMWDIEKVEQHIQQLEYESVLKYDMENQIVFIINFLKYNKIENPSQKVSAIKKLSEIKDSPLTPIFLKSAQAYCDKYYEELLHSVDTVTTPSQDPDPDPAFTSNSISNSNSISISNRNSNKDGALTEQNPINKLVVFPGGKESTDQIDPAFAEIVKLYEKLGFGEIDEMASYDLTYYYEQYQTDWIIDAMREAARYKKTTMKYVNGILKNRQKEEKANAEPEEIVISEYRGSDETNRPQKKFW